MNNSFASRIKELRNSINATQAKFAEELGTTQAALSAYEKGERIPSYEILYTIAQKYNVSIDWLFGLNDKKNLSNDIQTYADAFKLLVSICSTKYKDSNSEIMFPSSFENNNGDMLFIISEDTNFCDFFAEWKKIYELNKAGTIDNELYNLWLEKHFKDYEQPIKRL